MSGKPIDGAVERARQCIVMLRQHLALFAQDDIAQAMFKEADEIAAALSQQPEPKAEARGVVDAAIVEFVEGYEFCGEDSQGREGYYTPNERERMLIEDALRGWEAEKSSSAAGERHG